MQENNGFLKQIEADDVIVTANRRLSTHLANHYYQDRLEDTYACPTPKILPLSQWLTEVWTVSSPTEVLIDTQQSLFVWLAILNADRQRSPLLDTQRAAALLQEAWQLLNQWKIPLESLKEESSEDVLAFVRWADGFGQRCQQNAWIESSQLPEKCLSFLLSYPEKLPKRIFVVGFDSMNPSIQSFFNALSEKTQVVVPSASLDKAQKQRLAISDPETEYRLMAQWAKKQWTQNPTQRIGCLIPELLSARRSIERIFQKEFAEDLNSAVNISGGYSLVSYPIIQIIFTSLKLMGGQSLSRSEISSFLLSPFLEGGQTEFQTRAILDRALRARTEDFANLKSLFRLFAIENSAPEFLKKLLEADRLVAQQPSKLYPSQWAILLSELLTQLGWPGDQPLSSIEYQSANSFQQQLRRYASLDWLVQEQNFSSAIDSLKMICANTLFQAESEQNASIQVLGMLEASALQFDQLWICNMNDDRWPRPASPNPFLPISMQRELGMPRSSGSHECDYAKNIMQRLALTTSSLIASYSLQDPSENSELSPSSLILDFTEINSDDLGLSVPKTQKANPQTEAWTDDQAPPVKPNEKLRGGATILKRQAECPFWAFAEIRLKATPFEDLELGLSAAERGSLVHAVLAEIWHHLGDSQALSKLTESALNNLLKESITKVLNNASLLSSEDNENSLSTVLKEIESQRLQQTLLQWFALEKTRRPFKVSAIEKPIHLTLGNLSLSLQVDRIDTLEDGSQIIIDYKTGLPSPSSWFGDRPDEPQLPLYALQNPTQVQGLAFAQVRSQSIKFNGITAEVDQLPGVKPSTTEWSIMIEEWQNTLSRLAEQFWAGDATVTPKKYPGTCAYCHLASVCRVNELELVEHD